MTPTPLGFEALNHSLGQDHEKEADNFFTPHYIFHEQK